MTNKEVLSLLNSKKQSLEATRAVASRVFGPYCLDQIDTELLHVESAIRHYSNTTWVPGASLK